MHPEQGAFPSHLIFLVLHASQAELSLPAWNSGERTPGEPSRPGLAAAAVHCGEKQSAVSSSNALLGRWGPLSRSLGLDGRVGRGASRARSVRKEELRTFKSHNRERYLTPAGLRQLHAERPGHDAHLKFTMSPKRLVMIWEDLPSRGRGYVAGKNSRPSAEAFAAPASSSEEKRRWSVSASLRRESNV